MSDSYGSGRSDSDSVSTTVHLPPTSNESGTSTVVWIGIATDVILFLAGIVMLSLTTGPVAKAGGAYAWAKTLVGLTGVSLVIVSALGVISSICALCSCFTKSSSYVLLGQVICLIVIILLKIISLGLFFSFFGSLQTSQSTVVDQKYPVFSNFANCTWNTCCAMTHVRERSFTKLDCNTHKTGVASLESVCLNLPRASSNATACVGGDGLVHFRRDLSTWIFAEVMSWSWIVATVLILEVASFCVYGLRWNSVRWMSSQKKALN